MQLTEKPQNVDMGSCTTVTSFTSLLLIISLERLNKTPLDMRSDLLVLFLHLLIFLYTDTQTSST